MMPEEEKGFRRHPWIPPPAKTTRPVGAEPVERALPEDVRLLKDANLNLCKRARVLLGERKTENIERRERPRFRAVTSDSAAQRFREAQQKETILEARRRREALGTNQGRDQKDGGQRVGEPVPISYTDSRIEALQQELALRRDTVQNLMEELQILKNDTKRVKEGLKKAVIVQRERAKNAEKQVESLKEEMQKKDAYIQMLQVRLYEERKTAEEYTEREQLVQLERHQMAQRLKELEQQVAESIAGSCETLHKLVNQYQSHVLRQIPDGASPAHVAAPVPTQGDKDANNNQSTNLLDRLKDTNDLLRNEIGRKDLLLRQCSEQLEGKIREVAALSMRPSVSQPDLRGRESKEQEFTDLRRQIEAVKREKKQAESRLKIEISELKEKLLTVQAKDEVKQQYINAVKSSYTSMFGGSVPDPVFPTDSGTEKQSTLSL